MRIDRRKLLAGASAVALGGLAWQYHEDSGPSLITSEDIAEEMDQTVYETLDYTVGVVVPSLPESDIERIAQEFRLYPGSVLPTIDPDSDLLVIRFRTQPGLQNDEHHVRFVSDRDGDER